MLFFRLNLVLLKTFSVSLPTNRLNFPGTAETRMNAQDLCITIGFLRNTGSPAPNLNRSWQGSVQHFNFTLWFDQICTTQQSSDTISLSPSGVAHDLSCTHFVPARSTNSFFSLFKVYIPVRHKLNNCSECAPLNFVMASAAFRLCGTTKSTICATHNFFDDRYLQC